MKMMILNMMNMENYLYLLAILYFSPIIRIALFWFPPLNWSFLRKMNAVLGRIEWFVRPLRDSLLMLAILGIAAVQIYSGRILQGAILAPFPLLSIYSIVRYRLFCRKILILARENPTANPKMFFECYYSGFGPFPTKLPSAVEPVSTCNISYKRERPASISFLPALFGAFNTATIANLLIRAYKWKGPEYARELSVPLSVIWGERALQLGKLAFKVEGLENINGLKGKFVFALTHKSFLDFFSVPLILYPNFAPRFLAARDHFLDNPFLYLILGRAMKLAGTIFVDRRKKTALTHSASAEAAHRLASLDTDIVIFPQGTRAYPNVSHEKKRLDSGYYTSLDKIRGEKVDGHIRHGVSHIALCTAIELKNREGMQVHVVPIALTGHGLAAPKRSWRIQTETQLTAKIGTPITIGQKDVKELTIDTPEYQKKAVALTEELDIKLKTLLETHPKLEQRFFKDLRGLIPASDYEHVSVAMKAWRGKDYLIYTLLDCIYATRPANWPTFLRELCYLMVSDAPQKTLMHFKSRIVDAMIDGTLL